jgi:hypothetical protein
MFVSGENVIAPFREKLARRVHGLICFLDPRDFGLSDGERGHVVILDEFACKAPVLSREHRVLQIASSPQGRGQRPPDRCQRPSRAVLDDRVTTSVLADHTVLSDYLIV